MNRANAQIFQGETFNKVLLMSLPFNDPQIPPLGISLIKGFLKDYGYEVTTIDANVEIQFRDIQDKYFNIISRYLPEYKMGNFYSMRLDVIQNHMMAYLNYTGKLGKCTIDGLDLLESNIKMDYEELVKIIIYKTFYVALELKDLIKLDRIVEVYFEKLESYILEHIKNEKTSYLGLAVNSVTLPSSLYVFKIVKDKYPHITTVAGGGIFADELAVNSANLEYFVDHTPYIDKIIIGEGERVWLKILEGELCSKQKLYTLKDIPEDLVGTLFFSTPDLSDFDINSYPYIPAYTSLGCPFNCNFCTIPIQWGKYRQKEPKQVAKEFVELSRKYGSQLLYVIDSILNPVISELAQELLRLDTPIYWDGSLRVSDDVSNIQNTLLWRKSGFYRARIGIETGSQRLLNVMDKKITVEQIKSSVSSLANAGIKTTTFWIIGYPGETEQDFQETLNLVEELKDDLYETTFRPYLYYKTVDGKDDNNAGNVEGIQLYPKDKKDKLIIETWIPNCEPSREEIYNRLNRFHQHINKLGVSNPYTLYELDKADKRWLELHDNAVPPIILFNDKHKLIDECRYVKELLLLKNAVCDNSEFDF